jgi:proteic killer suppression protein
VTAPGQWAMTIDQRWRICLELRKADADEIEIVHFHRG